ncbi:SDR family oxidoreductase [Catenulispora rubra]|uniref:SDR family oxidoreductase n=1 Tax=Catenulispora rubra TaxID=280293 RepID=UPI001892088F|nr:SDR family oxidoreductase [Catenulispora rubra]
MSSKHEEHVVVIGGSSGMGYALAASVLAAGDRVTIVGRDAARLAAARKQLQADGPGIATAVADVSEESAVERLFAGTGPVDHVVITAVDATGAYQHVSVLDLPAARRLIDTKILGAALVAKHAAPTMPSTGSITFTSGIAAYRPAPGGSIVAAVNGALESLAAALALELAPLRVNVVSPGWVDTPVWDAIAGDGKAARLGAMADRLPAGRVGAPQDIAQAFRALMANGFITGTVLHVDGGHRFI